MKPILFIFLFLFSVFYNFTSCKTDSSKTDAISNRIDSNELGLQVLKDNRQLERMKEDMRDLHEYGMESDTQYMFKAPIKILEAKSFNPYKNGNKKIVIKYQNISSEEIESVKLHWCYTNSFGHITEQGSGFDYRIIKNEDEPIYLKPGEIWTYKGSGGYLESGKNLAHIWATQIFFKNHSAWYVSDIK